jgi:hypothetical protein
MSLETLVWVSTDGAWFAVTQATTLMDILSVLSLVQEEIVVALLHWDAEEVVDGSRYFMVNSC